jgi:hypothetical protein
MRRSLILSALLLATACSTRLAERKTAERLAGQVSHMQTSLATLAESRVAIAAARAQVSRRLLQSALETEVLNAENIENLLNDEQRARLETTIQKADVAIRRRAKADSELADADARARADADRVNPRSDELGLTAKLLSRLADKERWREQMKFSFHFFNELKITLDDVTQTAQKNLYAANELTAAQQQMPRPEKEMP